MLTIFSSPKPFRGHIEVIQRNAILSWLQLRPPCEVFLLGSGYGTAAIARELKVPHIPEIETNELGTPLVSSLFQRAAESANNAFLCYVNADIILMEDFLKAARSVIATRDSFLVVGRRWDLEVTDSIDFVPGWQERLRRHADSAGHLHGHSGLDYLLYSKGLWNNIPPFALGRGAWDNWLVFDACRRGATVIDATCAIRAIHQNHNYSHIGGTPKSFASGIEFERNISLCGGYPGAYTSLSARYVLTDKGTKPVRLRRFLYSAYRMLKITAIRCLRGYDPLADRPSRDSSSGENRPNV